MGLLDDAIREHMELKRLRGGDPDVLARQEQDALGAAGEEHDGEGNANGMVANAARAAEPSGEVGAGASGPSVENQGREVTDSPEPSEGVDPDVATVREETAELDMRSVLNEQHDAADRAAQLDSAGLGSANAEELSPGEDVLEETPEFLRDTPEQERLWFEQQKPRDFDFDK